MILVLAGLAGLLLACGPTTPKGLKASPDWSRSLRIGEAARGSIGMAVAGEGAPAYVVWPYEEEDRLQLRFVRLDGQARPGADRFLDVPPGLARTPALIPIDGDRLHLLWARRDQGGLPWELWYAQVDGEGQVVGDLVHLSEPEEGVGSYAVARHPDGAVTVVWERSGLPRITGITLGPEGDIRQGRVTMVSDGDTPNLRLDSTGELHLLWLQEMQLFYAAFPAGELAGVEGTPIAELTMGTGDSLAGTALGLSEGWVYALWSLQRQAGLEAGTSHTAYVSFPIGQPEAASRPVRLWIPPFEDPSYASYDGSYALTQVIPPPGSAIASSDFIYQPDAVGDHPDELAVVVAVSQQFRLDSYVQLAMALFDEGAFQGYVWASKTRTLSQAPVIVADDDRELHLAWREGSSGQWVYYASTRPEIRARLDQLDTGDFVNAALQGVLEGFASVLFFPILGFLWIFPGVILLVFRRLFLDHEDPGNPTTLILLGSALVVYELIKVFTLPTILTYVPYSAWLEIPENWRLPLQIGAPLFIIAVSLGVAEWVRRGRAFSSLIYYFSFAVTDSLLTLSIYGVSLLGVY